MSEALVPIGDIEVGHRFRRDMGDLEALAASIDHVGLLHALVVHPSTAVRDGQDVEGPGKPWLLIAGERRLRACEMLGWERVPVRVVITDDILAAEHDENAVRLDFSPSEAVAIAEALRPAVEQMARERQATLNRPGASSETDRARTDDRLATAVGMGRTSLRQATEVVRAAEQDPTLQPLVEHMDDTGKVEPAHKVLRSLPQQPSQEEVKRAIASRDAAYDRNFPGWREEEAAAKSVEQWWDSWRLIRREYQRHKPEEIVPLLSKEDIDDLGEQVRDLYLFVVACRDAVATARTPHLVKGDVS